MTRLRIGRKVYRKLCSLFRESWPRERAALLFGQNSGKEISISAFYDLGEGSRDSVIIQVPSALSLKTFTEHGLELVGTIHTHPYTRSELDGTRPTAEPSETDYEMATTILNDHPKAQVMAICALGPDPRTGKVRIFRTRWWTVIKGFQIQWE